MIFKLLNRSVVTACFGMLCALNAFAKCPWELDASQELIRSYKKDPIGDRKYTASELAYICKLYEDVLSLYRRSTSVYDTRAASIAEPTLTKFMEKTIEIGVQADPIVLKFMQNASGYIELLDEFGKTLPLVFASKELIKAKKDFWKTQKLYSKERMLVINNSEQIDDSAQSSVFSRKLESYLTSFIDAIEKRDNITSLEKPNGYDPFDVIKSLIAMKRESFQP